jgi:hypothetical protein
MGAGGSIEDQPNPHANMNDVIDPSNSVAGTIEPSPALAAQLKAGEVIYLMVKPVDPKTGAVPEGAQALAVDKAAAPDHWPLTFAVNAPAGTPVAVIARATPDGEAIRHSGDLEGVVNTTAPAKDLKVVIDTPVP